jgi:hypothetical protein
VGKRSVVDGNSIILLVQVKLLKNRLKKLAECTLVNLKCATEHATTLNDKLKRHPIGCRFFILFTSEKFFAEIKISPLKSTKLKNLYKWANYP